MDLKISGMMPQLTKFEKHALIVMGMPVLAFAIGWLPIGWLLKDLLTQ